jgi:hypothetical protein
MDEVAMKIDRMVSEETAHGHMMEGQFDPNKYVDTSSEKVPLEEEEHTQ